MKPKCVFTTTIADTPACALNDGGEMFDGNGIPLKDCPEFPCNKYKETVESWRLIDLGRLLNEKQSIKNDGRGVSCVKTIADYLRRSDSKNAIAVYENEGDKICGVYPDLDEIICKGLKIKPRYGE
jgi:hypothetical protein